ncbi:TetR/AcrR family transcriptional regulator [Sphingomonas aliaeris]|uniref:TetR/AcrR family transcriptional regulator n=2 Tax=Sphingomonas aliaeris TaxID=2759526 RepID=A0A974S5N5_9SPHN|nr:TetR/AcrR family transcriptional regulator [Sphingomonas aliaeris]
MQDLIDLEAPPLATLPARERILRTASDLFYRYSVHTIGIDRIIAESGVAKMTFYKYFPSKAQLVADYLRHKTVGWLGMLAAAADQPGLSPIARVEAIFDALDGPFRTPPFRGCPFVKGLAEFGPEADSPDVKATIATYFEKLHALVAGVIAPLSLAEPEKAVLQVLTLVNGSIVLAQATADPGIASACKDAARTLLEAAPKR